MSDSIEDRLTLEAKAAIAEEVSRLVRRYAWIALGMAAFVSWVGFEAISATAAKRVEDRVEREIERAVAQMEKRSERAMGRVEALQDVAAKHAAQTEKATSQAEELTNKAAELSEKMKLRRGLLEELDDLATERGYTNAGEMLEALAKRVGSRAGQDVAVPAPVPVAPGGK